MNVGRTIFSQLMDFVSRYEFDKCVKRYKGHYRTRRFSCWDQFLCLAFAQLTYRESLRDIEVCLRALGKKLYHTGIRGRVARSTLADANNAHDWRIDRDFANVLIAEARKLYVDEPFGVELDEVVYALDATIISLCLSVFPWARYMDNQGGVKLHTQIDLRGNIPVFIAITDAKRADVHLLDVLIPEAGAIYVMDRGYVDFKRLYKIHRALAFFVTRAKRKLSYKRVRSHLVDVSSGVHSDQTIKLRSRDSAKHYPERLRRIRYFDEEQQRFFVFLTNNFSLSAKTIADLYRCRWQIE